MDTWSASVYCTSSDDGLIGSRVLKYAAKRLADV